MYYELVSVKKESDRNLSLWNRNPLKLQILKQVKSESDMKYH